LTWFRAEIFMAHKVPRWQRGLRLTRAPLWV